jgi:hypothetical protein
VTLLDHLRDYLAAEGVVRDPDTQDPSLPPMWVEPRTGVPAPGKGNHVTRVGKTLVLGAFFSGGIPPAPLEGFRRMDTVDIWIRALNAPDAHTIEQAIRDKLIDKQDWDMAGLRITDSQQWRPFQRLNNVGSQQRNAGGRVDRVAEPYDFVVAYLFETTT